MRRIFAGNNVRSGPALLTEVSSNVYRIELIMEIKMEEIDLSAHYVESNVGPDIFSPLVRLPHHS